MLHQFVKVLFRMPVAFVRVQGTGQSKDQQCDERHIFNIVAAVLGSAEQYHIHSFDSDLLSMDWILDAKYARNVEDIVHGKPRKREESEVTLKRPIT